ncbi:biopolymer transporter Tol [Kribbella sp. NPDC051770]|uniref:TolB family protein n=1 Tax=Kribbella sp. NPDC051770 TaxID=3155413 RepID=UPI00342BB0D4
MARTLADGQTAEVYVVDVRTGVSRLVFSSRDVLVEAPNWSPDGKWLVVNGDGKLFRLSVEGGELEEIPLGGVPEINNDHVIGPDGETVYVSAEDGHLYGVTDGAARRVSNERGVGFRYYLHGVSPDGSTLAYIGMDAERRTNVWTIPSSGGDDVAVTDDAFADDGAEFGPDGEWIYFNSERASANAQLFRIRGEVLEQLTHDERVNWFPHPAPDGSAIAYVSFPPGTVGHPADVEDVRVRLLVDGEIREVATVFGGQGTMNVASWSPDSRFFAYVAYPVG